MNEDHFKECTFCEHSWPDREAFLADSAIKFIGYQSFVSEGVLGLFLFNHLRCNTTLALSAKYFSDLHGDVIYKSREDYDESDPACLSSTSGETCPVECECGFVRKVVGIIHGSAGKNGNSASE